MVNRNYEQVQNRRTGDQVFEGAKLGEGFAQGIHTQFQLMEESDKLGVDDPEDP